MANVTLLFPSSFNIAMNNESLDESAIENLLSTNSNVDFSHVPEQRASVIIWVYFSPVLLLLGTFGNVSTIVVLRRIVWGDSTLHFFLVGLAVVDLTLLGSSLLRRWIYYAFDVDVRDLHWVVCKLHIWVTYSVGTMSAWFLVTVTAHRTMAVMWPHRIFLLCTPRKAKTGVAVVTLLSCAFNAHLLYGYSTEEVCDREPEYNHFALVIHPWLDLTVSSLLPFLLLIFCNSALIWRIRTSVKNIRTLSANSSTRQIATRRRIASSMTVTLIAVSITFLVLTLPICIYLLWYNSIEQNLDAYDQSFHAKSNLMFAIASMLWYTNSAINFLIYCVSGRKFRNGFLALFRCSRHVEPSTPLTCLTV